MNIFDLAKARILAGKGGGNIINPDGSGVIKVDLNERAGATDIGCILFKLADEPYRLNPNTPVPWSRISKISFMASPWLFTGGHPADDQHGYLEAKTTIQNPYVIEIGPDDIEYYDGYEALYCIGPRDEWDTYIYRVTADNAYIDGGVKLSKGLYVKSTAFNCPTSLEISRIIF